MNIRDAIDDAPSSLVGCLRAADSFKSADMGQRVDSHVCYRIKARGGDTTNTNTLALCSSFAHLGGHHHFGVDGVLSAEGEHAGLAGARQGSMVDPRGTDVPVEMYDDVGGCQRRAGEFSPYIGWSGGAQIT